MKVSCRTCRALEEGRDETGAVVAYTCKRDPPIMQALMIPPRIAGQNMGIRTMGIPASIPVEVLDIQWCMQWRDHTRILPGEVTERIVVVIPKLIKMANDPGPFEEKIAAMADLMQNATKRDFLEPKKANDPGPFDATKRDFLEPEKVGGTD